MRQPQAKHQLRSTASMSSIVGTGGGEGGVERREGVLEGRDGFEGGKGGMIISCEDEHFQEPRERYAIVRRDLTCI